MNKVVPISSTPEQDITALVVDDPSSVLLDDAIYEKFLAKLRSDAAAFEPDLSTATSRKRITSEAFKITRHKTAIDDAGKKLNEDARKQINAVDAKRRRVKEDLDALATETRLPLTNWEKQEDARIEYCKSILRHIEEVGNGRIDGETYPFPILFRELEEKIVINAELGEFEEPARAASRIAMDKLKAAFEAHQRAETDRIELEKLRAEKAERDRLEMERLAAEELAREAKDRAERERLAEERRKEELAAAAERAALRAEQEAQEKIEAAKREAAEAEARHARAIQAAEEARQREAEEAKRREAEAEERRLRDIAEAKAQADRAAEAERQRLADIAAAEAAEQKRRDDDKSHRKAVNTAIVKELVECSGITAEQAQKIVVHMVSGLVPNVTLKY